MDSEGGYHTPEMVSLLSAYSYGIEKTPPRDKHAGGIAERSVLLMENMTNVAMLAPVPPVPRSFWDYAMRYCSVTTNFNYKKAIGTSPYHYSTGCHVDVKMLHPFFANIWVLVPGDKRES